MPAEQGQQIVTTCKAEHARSPRNTLMLLLIMWIVGYAFITFQWLMGVVAAAFVFMALRMPRQEKRQWYRKVRRFK